MKGFEIIRGKLLNTKYPLYSYVLMANGLVYLGWQTYLIGSGVLKKHFMLSRENIRQGRLHTLVTHSFTHISLYHLLSNSLGLYFIGGHIEKIFGPSLFLKIFLTGVVLGGLIQASTNFQDRPMIGSSNGVSALLGYFIGKFPYQKIYIFPFPIPISAWLLGAGYFFLNYQGYQSYDSVGYAGHLSGFLTGLGYYFISK